MPLNPMNQFDLRVTEHQPQALEFVLEAVFCEAITISELQQWACLVIQHLDEPPLYLFELMDFSGQLASIDSVIGFVGDEALTVTERQALAGIADKRGVTRFEQIPIPRIAAAALTKKPEILQRFQCQFPFIPLMTGITQ